jgi:hypothetical protein
MILICICCLVNVFLKYLIFLAVLDEQLSDSSLSKTAEMLQIVMFLYHQFKLRSWTEVCAEMWLQTCRQCSVQVWKFFRLQAISGSVRSPCTQIACLHAGGSVILQINESSFCFLSHKNNVTCWFLGWRCFRVSMRCYVIQTNCTPMHENSVWF